MGHFNITPPVEVAIPSDMSIQVTEVQGADDQPIVLATNYLKFIFFDRERNMVECVHDPTGQTSVNTEYDQDTGILRLLVPTRGMITGQLSCKVFTRTADPAFADGHWDVCTPMERINIKLVD